MVGNADKACERRMDEMGVRADVEGEAREMSRVEEKRVLLLGGVIIGGSLEGETSFGTGAATAASFIAVA